MVATSNAPPITTTPAEDAIARLKELTNKLTDAIEALKSHLRSLPGDTETEKILINLGQKHALRTSALLANVPNSPDGLLTAINLVQTYLQVTEILSQTSLNDMSGQFRQEEVTAIVQPYIEARQALDTQLIIILTALKNLPPATPVTVPETGNIEIDKLIEKTNCIVNTLDTINSTTPVSTEKVKDFIKDFTEYLEQDAKPILTKDGSALTEAQISLLIEKWGVVMEKLPSIVPKTEEERKQVVTQFLKIRYLLENNYDLLAEILRLKDPLGFRTP